MSKSNPEPTVAPRSDRGVAGGQSSGSQSVVQLRSGLRGLDLATQMKTLTPRENVGGKPVQRKDGNTPPEGAGEAAPAEQCYVHTPDMSIEVDCPEGGQAELDAALTEDEGEAREQVAASVAWDGPLTVRLMGIQVGKSTITGVHRQALAELRDKSVAKLAADPRVMQLADADMLPGDEPPWWETIESISGSASPEGKEEQNTNLAIERAGEADARLCELGAGQWESYQPKLRAEPHRDRKTPEAQWPALRSVTVHAEVGSRVLDNLVVPPQEMADASGDQLREALPEPVAPTPSGPAGGGGGKSAAGTGGGGSHEFKGNAGKKPAPGAPKKAHEVGVTFGPGGTEIVYKRTLEKSWPIPLAPGLFAEATIGGSIGGSGTKGPTQIEGALTGDLSASLTLNGGVPNVASLYVGGAAKLAMKGSFSYDSRTKETNGKAKGSLIVEAKIGAKAQLGIPQSLLPAGWDPIEVGLQYEYKPGGEWELFVVEWDEGELTWTEGKDLAAVTQAVSDFADSAKNASSAVSDYLGGIDPYPNREKGEGLGLGLGGRNME